jgi:hypothetical protein
VVPFDESEKGPTVVDYPRGHATDWNKELCHDRDT